MTLQQAKEILDFWFGLRPEQYWQTDERLDAEIKKRFFALWQKQRRNPADVFLGNAEMALAAIILFDQFPRNMFRNHADSFATDPLALAIAKAAIERGYDEMLSKDQRVFFYMPFEHSEVLTDQQRSLGLFTALGDPYLLRFANLHHDIIVRFGRFPHRNTVLGRQPRAEEIAAGDIVPW
jgi:uncharacterized protein (DUF924 family)